MHAGNTTGRPTNPEGDTVTGSGYTTEALPISMCCAGWRDKPQHGDCPGWVLPGNRTDVPKLPCGCRECADDPKHRAARELAGAHR